MTQDITPQNVTQTAGESPFAVLNQPTPLKDINLYELDPVLREAVHRENAEWAKPKLREFGAQMGSEVFVAAGFEANRQLPELRAFDRYGHRIDEVVYHPSYHNLMQAAITEGVHAIAWTAGRPGAHVAHAALEYLLGQTDQGVCCPITMTYAAIPALRLQPEVAREWEPRLLSQMYDSRFIPADGKTGATCGMAMTEKQGGSDVRANITRAQPLDSGVDNGQYALYGHKWFCSAPMSDVFLTVANTHAGLSCFLVPRWRPDGTRNPFAIQRLKDKLGNRSNASAEIEYHGTWARRVGEPGRGIATIIQMVHHTRLDTATAPTGLMRQALLQALHHAAHRQAFGRRLIDQPLMRNVLADLTLEWEAAVTMVMRVARSFDDAEGDPAAHIFSRLAVAVAKFWINKRAPAYICEALECLGGGGYVEESILPRLYREAPLNGIWEGSGNVICLDILRSLSQEPEAANLFVEEVERARGANPQLDATIQCLKDELVSRDDVEQQARRLTRLLALSLEASLLVRHAPTYVSDAFCAARLQLDSVREYGDVPTRIDSDAILRRVGVMIPG